MKIFHDYPEFAQEVGKLFWFEAIRLDIDCPIFDGVFDNKDIVALQEFCQRNPEYHIMSWMDGDSIKNKLDFNGVMFMLGNGNPDPELIYIPTDTELIWPTPENIKTLVSDDSEK